MARRSRPPRPLFPRGAGLGFRAFILAIVALAMWFTDQRGNLALEKLRGVLATGLHPLMLVSASPATVVSAAQQFRNRNALAADNRVLKQNQMLLQTQLLKYRALEAENRRLRQLVASASVMGEKTKVAEIIAVSHDPYQQQITLNLGASAGVYQGQALVDAYGVFGQVIRVNPQSSTALLITDPGHGIPVEVNRTGLQTIARGGGGKDGRALVLPFLPGNADVQVGDLLVTSGLGGRFPPGYPVGEVFDAKRGTAVHFMQALATPAARLYQGRQVLLVWGEHPALEAASAAESAAEQIPPVIQNSGSLRPPVGAALGANAAGVAAVAATVQAGQLLGNNPTLNLDSAPKPPTAAALAAQAMGVAPGPTGGPAGLPPLLPHAVRPPAGSAASRAAAGTAASTPLAMQPSTLPRRNLPALSESTRAVQPPTHSAPQSASSSPPRATPKPATPAAPPGATP